jgi:hypothetical protein
MHRFFFSTKDTFINSGSSTLDGETFLDKNVGQDEILELKKVFYNRTFRNPTRVLIKFDADEIENFISSSNIGSTSYSASLRLYETKGTSGLSETYKIAAYPISQSWDEGFGNVNKNYGFLLRFSGSGETSTGSFEDLKFFSRQTNTIYSPKLELKWDDHTIVTGSATGSLTALDLSGEVENYVYPIHFREAYKETETIKFRFGARKRYINKSFTTSVQTVSGSYFAEGSASYSIIDLATNESVVPFSSYTSMSCDSVSPYFKQDLNGFEPNRAYKILIKVNHNDNQTIIYDDDFEFILRV